MNVYVYLVPSLVNLERQYSPYTNRYTLHCVVTQNRVAIVNPAS